MGLKGARGPLQMDNELWSGLKSFFEAYKVADAILDALCERCRLLLPGHDENDFSGVHDRSNSNRKGHARYSSEIIVEEASVGKDRLVGEGLDASARDEGRAGLQKVDRRRLSYLVIEVSHCSALTSLKARCPSSPMPPKKMSMPPTLWILRSYSAHSSSRSSASPSRRWVLAGLMSILEKKLVYMKVW